MAVLDNSTDILDPRNESDTATHTRLTGTHLVLARSATVGLIGLSVVLFVLGLFRFPSMAIDRFGEDVTGALAFMRLPPAALLAYVIGIEGVRIAAYLGTALLIFLRRSDDRMGLFLAAMLVSWGASISSALYVMPPGTLVNTLAQTVIIIGSVLFVIFLFTQPAGKFDPPWTQWVVAFYALWTITSVYNFYGALGLARRVEPAEVIVPLFTYSLAALALGYRYQHTFTETQRQQFKWLVGGLMLAFVGYVVFVASDLFIAQSGGGALVLLAVDLTASLITVVCLSAFPMSIAASILKYRLWDVDLVLNRGIVYGTVSLLLGGLFAFAFFLVLYLTRLFTGGQEATIAITAGAVIAGAAFNPLRQWIQREIDRRVYGIEIDYRAPRRGDSQGASLGQSLVGSELGPYQVIASIGRGGMAEVYKGLHPTLNRPVAIKVLSPVMVDKSDMRARFEREAQTVAALRHAHIVQVFDFGVIDETYFMVMEYIDGPSLADLLREKAALRYEDCLSALSEVASALDYAHQQGLVHRDIKPSNVMMRRDSSPYGELYRAILTDFGIAKIRGGGASLTHTGMMGTLDYIAPEQISSSREVDGRADVYSLGVMAFQMLTGELPFKGDHPAALLIAHLQQPPPDPLKLRSDLPREAAAALVKALSKQPDQRYQTAGAFVSDLLD